MLSMIPHLEQNEGTFYPEGGMISITNALHKLALKKGVNFCFNTKVDKILHQDGQVTGVMAGGKSYQANMVVSNMDVYYVYRDLLNNEAKAASVLKRERSSSAMIFYWGMKKEFLQLHLHNIFFTENYAEEFRHLFVTKEMYSDPTIYVNITSKMEAGQAPAGCENWFVMLNAPANTGQDWTQVRLSAKHAIIDKLSRMLGEDIAPFIETERVLDPTGIEAQTLSHMGSLYGTSSNSLFAAFLRHPNSNSSIKGLYFTGGSVHPGGGIPLCLKSAKIAARLAD
jgi:phytoene desaturase